MKPLKRENAACVCDFLERRGEMRREGRRGEEGVEKTRAQGEITVIARAVIVQWFKGGRLY